MERKVNSSVAEADACEAKVELMEGVLVKLKVGTEEVGQSLVYLFGWQNRNSSNEFYVSSMFLVCEANHLAQFVFSHIVQKWSPSVVYCKLGILLLM